MRLVDGVPILPLQHSKVEMEIVVVICLIDGMLHRKTAEMLYGIGYRKILFLPLEYELTLKEKVVLINRYNRLLSGEDVYEEVEEYVVYSKHRWKDTSIIRTYDDCIIAWVGQEIIFSEDINQWKGDLSKIHKINDGIDTNLNAYYWIHQLYDYFEGKRMGCDAYLDNDIIMNTKYHFVENDLKFMHPGILYNYLKGHNNDEYMLLEGLPM